MRTNKVESNKQKW